MKKLVLFLLCVGLCELNCTTTQKAVKIPGKPTQPPAAGLVEDFDPMSLTDDHFVIEPKVQKEAEASANATASKADSLRAAAADSSKEKNVQVQGYRVQIAAVSNQAAAAEIRDRALLSFTYENIYLIFEAAYYKVRIGDFEQRHDAEELQKQAVSLGYQDAWIVRTIIEKKVSGN